MKSKPTFGGIGNVFPPLCSLSLFHDLLFCRNTCLFVLLKNKLLDWYYDSNFSQNGISPSRFALWACLAIQVFILERAFWLRTSHQHSSASFQHQTCRGPGGWYGAGTTQANREDELQNSDGGVLYCIFEGASFLTPSIISSCLCLVLNFLQYLVVKYDSFAISHYSLGIVDVLGITNKSSHDFIGSNIFKFLSQHTTALPREYKSKVKDALKHGQAISASINLFTLRSLARSKGDDKFFTHWTPCKDERGFVAYAVVTLSSTLYEWFCNIYTPSQAFVIFGSGFQTKRRYKQGCAGRGYGYASVKSQSTGWHSNCTSWLSRPCTCWKCLLRKIPLVNLDPWNLSVGCHGIILCALLPQLICKLFILLRLVSPKDGDTPPRNRT